ncbi:MAG TPA: restriction endonuclease subunit S [Gemmata sp.]
MAKTRKPTAESTTTATKPLPAGWRWFRFDELAKNINERVDDPSEAGVEHYVGLEHLDSDSLKIRRWGTPDDVEAQKLRFHPGDIIFGKRRAYQRKLCVAEFDGICSAHAMVLRADPKNIVPELLPFFMQTDAFMHRARAISKGSLSPTINWPDLAKQRFAIPGDRAEQERMLAILSACEFARQQAEATALACSTALSAFRNEVWKCGLQVGPLRVTEIGSIPAHWDVAPLNRLVESSAVGPRFPAEAYSESGNVRTIRTTDFDRCGEIIYSPTMPWTTLDDEVISRHRLVPGDFLFSRSGQYCGLVAVFTESEGTFIPAAFVIRFRLQPRLNPHYLSLLFYSDYGTKYVLALAAGGDQVNIPGSAVLKLTIPVPPLSEQHEIVKRAESLSARAEELLSQTNRLKKLKSVLLAHLLTPKAES